MGEEVLLVKPAVITVLQRTRQTDSCPVMNCTATSLPDIHLLPD